MTIKVSNWQTDELTSEYLTSLRRVGSPLTEVNRTPVYKLQFGIYVLRTNRALTVLVSLQTINTKYICRDRVM